MMLVILMFVLMHFRISMGMCMSSLIMNSSTWLSMMMTFVEKITEGTGKTNYSIHAEYK